MLFNIKFYYITTEFSLLFLEVNDVNIIIIVIDPVNKSEKILTTKLKKYLIIILYSLVLIIPFTYTIINEWTMMIVNCNTTITVT